MIEAPRIVASRAEVTVEAEKDQLDYKLSGQGVVRGWQAEVARQTSLR